ncbi:MAG: DUF4114 domain-containing protein [Terrimicrobiaceae bacterium]|nr:DUF4114 domain-containing protein [Terrimicrobiaceae bacterium]
MKATRFPLACGFTMIEVLAVLAAMAAIGAIGYVAVTDARKNAADAKLESDTATVNRAIEIFKASGGDPNALTGSGTTGVETVLTELKKRASSSTSLGVTGSALDARVWYEPSSASDPARAVWNNSTKRFEVVHSGGAGVKEFTLDETLASADPATASRTTAKETADNGWVWKHAPATEVAMAQGFTPVTGTAVNPGISSLISSDLDNGAFVVGESGTVTTEDKFYDGAGYPRGELGIFSLEGMGNPPYDLKTAEGLRDFMREAVRRVAEGGTQGGVAMDRYGDGKTLTFEPGTVVAFILIPDASFTDAQTFLSASDPSMASSKYPLTSLSFDTGDTTGFSKSQVVSLGNDVRAIADMAGGGDQDYEDIIWKTSGLTEPDWSTINTITDPIDYYSHWDNKQTAAIEDINILDRVGNDPLLNGTNPTLRQALQNAGAIP